MSAGRDGCGCPPWVVRCGHLPDGSLLMLADNQIPTPSWACSKHVQPDPTWPKFVIGHVAKPRLCECGLGQPSPCPFWTAATLAEAETEFFRREAELLGREPLEAQP